MPQFAGGALPVENLQSKSLRQGDKIGRRVRVGIPKSAISKRFCHPPSKVKFFFDVYGVEKGCDQLSPDLTLGHAVPLTVRVE
jgi:hypothetical protein